MQPTRTLLVTLAAGGMLLGAAITAGAVMANGASAAGSRTPAVAPSPTATAPGRPAPPAPGPGRGHGRLGPGGFGALHGLVGGPVLHGEFVTGGQNGSTTTVVVQSGSVTAKSGSTITVRSTDTYTVTWTLNDSTTVRTGWAQGAVKDIAVGDQVRVEGTRSGPTTTARFVAERPKNAPQGGQQGGGRSATPTPSATTTS